MAHYLSWLIKAPLSIFLSTYQRNDCVIFHDVSIIFVVATDTCTCSIGRNNNRQQFRQWPLCDTPRYAILFSSVIMSLLGFIIWPEFRGVIESWPRFINQQDGFARCNLSYLALILRELPSRAARWTIPSLLLDLSYLTRVLARVLLIVSRSTSPRNSPSRNVSPAVCRRRKVRVLLTVQC